MRRLFEIYASSQKANYKEQQSSLLMPDKLFYTWTEDWIKSKHEKLVTFSLT